MSDARSDLELVRRIAAGDQAAMRLFYDRYGGPVFHFLRSRGADDAAASDGVHDAMLEVWRRAETFRGRSSAKTWLFTIARNKFIDRIRKEGRVDYTDDVPDVVDDSVNAEAAAIAAQDRDRLRGCLKGLKPAHALVLRLAFYDDLTYQEISEAEGIPAGTVKTRIFHAKKLLMRCLGQA
ncbi:MAG: RNA polymerase sigma factor [Pseudomonadota bacterium]